jgi:hypothetical protein
MAQEGVDHSLLMGVSSHAKKGGFFFILAREWAAFRVTGNGWAIRAMNFSASVDFPASSYFHRECSIISHTLLRTVPF